MKIKHPIEPFLTKFISRLLVMMVAVYIFGLPFIFNYTSKETQESLDEYILLKSKVNSLVDYNESEDQIVLKLFRFVVDSIVEPTNFEKTVPKRAIEVLQTKKGSCDQQVLLFMQCLTVMDVEARMVFLFDEDSVSHHTVSEVNVNGKWGMFDPFYNRYFENSLTGKYFSVAEILDRSEEFHPIVIRDNYGLFFKDRYSPVTHQTNKLTGKFKWYTHWINSYCFFPGEYVLNLLR